MKGSTKLFLSIFIMVFINWTLNTIGHWSHFVLSWNDPSLIDNECSWVVGYIFVFVTILGLHGFSLTNDFEENGYNYKDYFFLSFGPFILILIIIKLADKYL